MSESVTLKIQIANRTYPLKVREDQRMALEKAAQLIQDKIKSNENHQGLKDLQDVLAMSLLQLAAETITARDHHHSNEEEMKVQLQEIANLVRSFE